MELEKTGALIREARKSLGLTQRELAETLHVTDRAVSKWERGLSAPDIALLEPLGAALGLSVTELIRGERLEQTGGDEEARSALEYAGGQLRQRLCTLRKKYAVLLLGWTMIALAVGGLLLWRSGLLFRLERCPSPDGEIIVSVYGRELGGPGTFSRKKGVSLIRVDGADGARSYINYGGCAYGGLWWSPDGRKYVMALDGPEGTRLLLDWVERNSVSNLNAYLLMSVGDLEWQEGLPEEEGLPEVDFHFLQWGRDGDSMLISYRFDDERGATRDGYFWYNCETGVADGVLRLEQ